MKHTIPVINPDFYKKFQNSICIALRGTRVVRDYWLVAGSYLRNRLLSPYVVNISTCLGSLIPNSSEESEERSSFSIPAVGKTAFRLSLFSVNSEGPSISMVKSAFEDERFLEDIDDNEGKNALRFDIPSLRGFNSPKVKLDADMSVATESPEKDTKDDIDAMESLDNLDKAEPRPLCLDRLECIGKAS